MTTIEKVAEELLDWKRYPSTDPEYSEIRVRGSYAKGIKLDGSDVNLTGYYLPISPEDQIKSSINREAIDNMLRYGLSVDIKKWISLTASGLLVLSEQMMIPEMFLNSVLKDQFNDIKFNVFTRRDLRTVNDYTYYKNSYLIRTLAAVMQMKKNYIAGGYIPYRCHNDWAISAPESIDNFLRTEFNMSVDSINFVASWLNGDIGGFIITGTPKHPRINRGNFFPLRLNMSSAPMPKSHRAIWDRMIESYSTTASAFRTIAIKYDHEYVTVLMTESIRLRLSPIKLITDVQCQDRGKFDHITPEEARAELAKAQLTSARETKKLQQAPANQQIVTADKQIIAADKQIITEVNKCLQSHANKALEYIRMLSNRWDLDEITRDRLSHILWEIDTIKNISSTDWHQFANMV